MLDAIASRRKTSVGHVQKTMRVRQREAGDVDVAHMKKIKKNPAVAG